MADKIDTLFNRNQADVARLLTDNDYLMQMRAAAQAVGKNTPGRINLSGLGLPFANIAGPKISTEKAAIRKYVEEQIRNNARIMVYITVIWEKIFHLTDVLLEKLSIPVLMKKN